jgi:hypothetical protein
MDRLEEYIRKNREELDQHIPSPVIWRDIKKGLKKGRAFYIKWLSAAAMIAVIFLTAALYYIVERRNNPEAFQGNKFTVNNTLLNETEIYYNAQVNNLYRQALPVLVQYPEIEEELVNDIAHIDSICAEIRKDLKDNISNQEVIEALINNYRLKIRILEDMLDLVKQEESDPVKKESHEL